MPRTTQVVSFSFPPQFVKELEKWAKKKNQTKSEFVREAVVDLIQEEQYTRRALQAYKATRGEESYTLKELDKEFTL